MIVSSGSSRAEKIVRFEAHLPFVAAVVHIMVPLEISFAKLVVLKNDDRGRIAFELKSLALSRTMPRKSATASAKKCADRRRCPWFRSCPRFKLRGWCAGRIGKLLQLLVGNLVARQFVPNDESKAIFGSEVALVTEREIARGARIGVILRDHGIQIMVGHAAAGAGAHRYSFPRILPCAKRRPYQSCLRENRLRRESRLRSCSVLTSTTPPIFRPYSAGKPAV